MAGRDEAEALIADWASKHLQPAPVKPRGESLTDTTTATTESYPSLVLYTYPENPRAYKGEWDPTSPSIHPSDLAFEMDRDSGLSKRLT